MESAGDYAVEIMASAGGDGSGFRLKMDDIDITGAVDVPNTGSWDTYEIISGPKINLTAGDHILRLEIDGSFCNIDWITFSAYLTPLQTNRNITIKPISNPYYDLLGRWSLPRYIK